MQIPHSWHLLNGIRFSSQRVGNAGNLCMTWLLHELHRRVTRACHYWHIWAPQWGSSDGSHIWIVEGMWYLARSPQLMCETSGQQTIMQNYWFPKRRELCFRPTVFQKSALWEISTHTGRLFATCATVCVFTDISTWLPCKGCIRNLNGVELTVCYPQTLHLQRKRYTIYMT